MLGLEVKNKAAWLCSEYDGLRLFLHGMVMYGVLRVTLQFLWICQMHHVRNHEIQTSFQPVTH